jgi:hypothetical protein
MSKQQFPVNIEVVVTQEDGMFIGKPTISCEFKPTPAVKFLPVIYAASVDGIFQIASACMSARSIRGSLKVISADEVTV